ncbi:hypothetical protein F9K91_05135 [Brucella tritici]|uniref:Recombinase RecT n=1 Tax=Brucella tritici TaxID=94626 RepID=A0A833CNQ5_9HYPH|nr:hypothetical protein [Brucella tritici]KAB2666568.1 hypothetical protein F9K91_05135 [Brucella tritici]
MSKALTTVGTSSAPSVFSTMEAFENAQRLVKPLIGSDLVPASYRGTDNMGNALIALDMANRMQISPLIVMQNLHVIEGRPSWSSKFVIGALGSCGLFSPIRWKIRDLGEVEAEKVEWSGPKGAREKRIVKTKIRDKEFIAYAVEKATGEILEGPPVTFSMAVAEGWYHRPGSKWLTMPDLMGRYRSASMFCGLYAPHILNGMPTEDEVIDITDYQVVAEEAPAPADGASDKRPASRPKGIHAAMQASKTEATAKPPKTSGAAPKPANVVDAEIVEDDDAEGVDAVSHENHIDKTSIQDSENDIFESPDDQDDDYNPA